MSRSFSAKTPPPTQSEQAQPEAAPAWHTLGTVETLTVLNAQPEGLTAKEAADRLAKHGPNALPASARRSSWHRLLSQIDNLLIYLLLGAAVITALLGHVVDTVVILAVVALNALIGYIQEGRAEEALDAIRNMISPQAAVLRDGRRVSLAAVQVVPGDVVLLEAGSRVPADLRLLKARNLFIDEAALTGESVPVEKSADAVAHAGSPLGERQSLAFSGTLVTTGQGTGVVVATGGASELGRISSLLETVAPIETPLIRQMNGLARQLSIGVVALSVATFAFAIAVRDYAIPDAFMVVVGMAVAAIPEGLPAVMTIALAIGVQRMATRNAIVRRLPAVETLGSVSTICTDKTGTLTRNEMMVAQVVLSGRTFEVSGVGYAPAGSFSQDEHHVDPATFPGLMRLARSAMLCNDSAIRDGGDTWHVEGDPMEGALVVLALKAGLDQTGLYREFPRMDEIPFDAAHRYMATLHHDHEGRKFLCVKGAPERILSMCSYQADGTAQEALDTGYWESASDRLAAAGYRVLAIASRQMPVDTTGLRVGDADGGLVLEGIVALIDPPRPDAIEAVAECHDAGIAVKMITGDHKVTASAIAAQIGLRNAETVATGMDIDAWDAATLQRNAHSTNVFARTSPEHKIRLVEVLQADGNVIAMTGDGVNDAPALKRADVGVAMGRNGTEAAKEAAEIVLADDRFSSIVAAVREGRTVYDNLVKVIGWTLPTNGGETLVILAAVAFGLALPVTPVQILWINMITAVGLGLVLAFEPPEPDIMKRAPREANTPLLSGLLLWRVGLVSILFAIGTFGMFAWARNKGASEEYARTLVVNTLVVMEIFYLYSVRFLHTTSLTLQGTRGTPAVLIGTASIIVLQFAFTYFPPLQTVFETRPVSLGDGTIVVAAGVVLFVVLEIEKQLRHRFLGFRWWG